MQAHPLASVTQRSVTVNPSFAILASHFQSAENGVDDGLHHLVGNV